MVSFEKKIISLLRKTNARRGHGVKALRRKRKPNSSSHFKKEIRKLECSVNYNRSLMIIKDRGRSNGNQVLVQ